GRPVHHADVARPRFGLASDWRGATLGPAPNSARLITAFATPTTPVTNARHAVHERPPRRSRTPATPVTSATADADLYLRPACIPFSGSRAPFDPSLLPGCALFYRVRYPVTTANRAKFVPNQVKDVLTR